MFRFIVISLFFLQNLLALDVDASKIEGDVKNRKINFIQDKIIKLTKEIESDMLYKKYSNHLNYLTIQNDTFSLIQEVEKISLLPQNKDNIDSIRELKSKIKNKTKELDFLDEYKESIIGSDINPKAVDNIPKVANPFSIIKAFSFKKKLGEYESEYNRLYLDIVELTLKLHKKQKLLSNLFDLDASLVKFSDLEKNQDALDSFERLRDSIYTTKNLYSKRIEEIIFDVDEKIYAQLEKIITILVIIGLLFIIFILVKLMMKKYFSDNNRFYITNKIINFIFISISGLILLFAYIENVSYMVTILGFASAGIAIALKDWFMSIFGWMVIVVGGSINVGDRIKVHKNGQEFVGDVLDISLFRITMQEDVTLTTYTVNRRAGRIIFVPNNYIFTEMISNYTHYGLKTVWDGVDIIITFDSNHKKAVHLARNICKQYAKGYIDITRTQLAKMRNKYDLRNSKLEPRVYTFIDNYGITVSSWFLNNSYATLGLRSTISAEIVDAFRKEDDIFIAYPTQTIEMQRNRQKPIMEDMQQPAKEDSPYSN